MLREVITRQGHSTVYFNEILRSTFCKFNPDRRIYLVLNIMGSYLGKAMKETMDENMKKNQEFMLASQKLQASTDINLF